MPLCAKAFVLCCLEKDPGRRPQSAAEALDDLARCDDLGEWGSEQAHRWWSDRGEAMVAGRPRETTEPETEDVRPGGRAS